MDNSSIKSIMTTELITVLPNTPLLEVAKILEDKNIDGVPVVDLNKKLLGVINEFDLLSKGTAIHLPTLNTVLKNLTMINKDHAKLEDQFKKVFNMTAQDVMNAEPLTLPETATFADAVKMFTEHHRVNPVPVIDTEHHVVGLVSRFDLLKIYRSIMPEEK